MKPRINVKIGIFVASLLFFSVFIAGYCPAFASGSASDFSEEEFISTIKEAEIFATLFIQPEIDLRNSPVNDFITQELLNTRPTDYFVEGKGYRLTGGLSRPDAYRKFMKQYFSSELIDSWLGRGTVFDEESDTVYWFPVSGPQEGYGLGDAKYTVTELSSERAVCHMDLNYDYYFVNTSFDYVYEKQGGQWVFTQFSTRADLICQVMNEQENSDSPSNNDNVKKSGFASSVWSFGVLLAASAVLFSMQAASKKRRKKSCCVVSLILSVALLSLPLAGCNPGDRTDSNSPASAQTNEIASEPSQLPDKTPVPETNPANENEWEYVPDDQSEDGGVVLLKYTGGGESISVPSEIGEAKVTRLGESLFANGAVSENLKNITFEGLYHSYEGALKGVKTLEEITFTGGLLDVNLLFGKDEGAVEAAGIKKATINKISSLKSVGLERLDGIKELVFDETLKIIEPGCFSGLGSLEKLSIPGVKTIPENAFSGIESLRSIDLSSITSIGKQAFFKCVSLESIHLGSELSFVGQSAFDGCSGLKKIRYDSPSVSFDDQVFGELRSLSELEFGDDVKSIPEKMMLGAGICGNLAVRGASLTAIGDRSFEGNAYMTAVSLPDTITTIGAYAFNYCASLTDFSFPSSITELKDGAFMNCCGLTAFTLPEGVRSVGKYLLCNCDRIKTVSLPDTFTEIPEGMFYGCADLNSFDHSCSSVGDKAFAMCTSLEKINTGAGTEFGDGVFDWCFSLIDAAP